jgi:hypothetical protein
LEPNFRRIIREARAAGPLPAGQCFRRSPNTQLADRAADFPAFDREHEGFGERPAIAVLPFRLLGAGHDAAHLADGITEDVIVALSRGGTSR